MNLDPMAPARDRLEEMRIETALKEESCVSGLHLLDVLIASMLALIAWLFGLNLDPDPAITIQGAPAQTIGTRPPQPDGGCLIQMSPQ
jgi:hypothetical protein